MNLRIAIVDDMKQDRSRLEKKLTEYFASPRQDGCTIRSYESGEAFLADFTAGTFDIAFLDILMDGMNGIELSASIRAVDSKILLIFLTSSVEFALDAYPAHPFDYLIKPVTSASLAKVMTDVLRAIGKKDSMLEVRAARDTLSVPYGAICSVVSHGHNVELHLSDKKTIKSTSTFRSLSDILTKDPRFLPCNRGILVNMNHVLALDGDLIRMKDGSTFPIRVNGRSAVISQFSQFMLRVMESGGRT